MQSLVFKLPLNDGTFGYIKGSYLIILLQQSNAEIVYRNVLPNRRFCSS